MSIGNDFRQAFEQMVEIMGCTVLIHKNWGTSDQKTTEVRGLKNNEKNRPDKVMFQFLETFDIQTGDVLQQKGARDLWRVIETQDEVHADVYVNFRAKVEKISGQSSLTSTKAPQVVVEGSVYGSIQVDSPHSPHTVTVQVLQLDENIAKLKELLQSPKIPELEREEADQALDRISQLVRREKSPDVIRKINEKLTVVKNIFSVAKDVALLAAPYMGAIARFVGS